MAEPTLYQRLGGIFAIAAVIDNFSDRLLSNPKIVDANPELHEWHTVTYRTRLPGLKWGRTLWVASLAGGPFEYTGREMRDAHFDLRISPAVFDEVSRNLPTPLMTSRCLSAKGRRSWPPSLERRARLRPVLSLGLSIAAGVEPGVIRTANSIRDRRTRRAAGVVTKGGQCVRHAGLRAAVPNRCSEGPGAHTANLDRRSGIFS
jgi:truncated hemoglobin YjbI